MDRFSTNLYARSVELVSWLDLKHRSILLYWTIIASAACGVRLSVGDFAMLPATSQLVAAIPYILVVFAPIVSLLLAFHWFRDGERQPQPEFRLALFGSWKKVTSFEARSYRFYGVAGIMASLIGGLLLNIPVRVLEFLAAMPTLPEAPPVWLSMLFALMLADVVLLTSFYAIASVAALKRVPLFPRLLFAVWMFDILMQILIAHAMGAVPELPAEVGAALHQLLQGNLQKVLISFAIWTPYLLLSKRVNATYRNRISD
ncbi:DUF2569 domain-containing protein [Parasphingopyxis sp. CP4]|uniref:DUF2569 family protein n=1 Tax=Parasphingopyxis sp. CP4 TaxID=2724527 RepID=UPI0015A4AD20|nr:DUF2569 family protein [Parasphingopyxis sp. CP4]QLC22452.1 DUF2569 domain-containing protein [Parasphingopyxis sp. CP4]